MDSFDKSAKQGETIYRVYREIIDSEGMPLDDLLCDLMAFMESKGISFDYWLEMAKGQLKNVKEE